MNQKAPAALIAALLAGWVLPSAADSTQARCEIYPKGSDKLEKMVPCTFGQRQGHITITRQDGITYDLSPVGDTPGNFRDQDGHPVYRQSGLGGAGQIFRFPKESLFVYWDNAASEPAGADMPPPPSPPSTRAESTTPPRCCAARRRATGSTATVRPASCAWRTARHRSSCRASSASSSPSTS